MSAPRREDVSYSTIRIRLSRETNDLIDRAAAAFGKTRGEFMLESARQRAVEVLFDQRIFHLDAAASEAFAEALENPPAPVEALRALLRSKPSQQ